MRAPMHAYLSGPSYTSMNAYNIHIYIQIEQLALLLLGAAELSLGSLDNSVRCRIKNL